MLKKYKDEINALAKIFYQMHGYRVKDDFDFSTATHPQEKSMWNLAAAAHEYFGAKKIADKMKRKLGVK